MSRTYEPIMTTTLASTQADIIFSNIPGTYTDLVIQGSVSSDDGTFNRGMLVRLNGDTGNNYSSTILYGEGSTVTSVRESNVSYMRWSELDLNTFTANFIHINNYANPNVFKTIISRGGARQILATAIGLWRNKNAINSIRIYLTGQSLRAGTTITIYGIKAE